MTVYVDELVVRPTPLAIFARGSCHLTADDAEELHAFARRIGLRRAWFQEHRVADHYDLTPRRRAAALRAGAVFVPMREQILRKRGIAT